MKLSDKQIIENHNRTDRNLLSVFFLMISGMVMYGFARTFEQIIHSRLLLSFFYTLPICLYIISVIMWTVPVYKRIVHRKTKRYLLASAAALILWIFITHIRHRFIPESSLMYRLLWYCYYIPMLFVPLFGFLSSMCIGDSVNSSVQKRIRIVYLPTILLVGIVLTNDSHHLVFDFNPDRFVIDGKFSHGVMYYIVMLWMVTLIASMFIILYRKCFRNISFGKAFHALAVVFFGIVYCVLYLVNPFSWFRTFFSLTYFMCFVFIMEWQLAIGYGFIATNNRYDEMMRNSTVSIRVTDRYLRDVYTSKSVSSVREYIKREAIKSPMMLDPDTKFSSEKIRGGYVFWEEDVGELNSALEKLKEIQSKIREENELLRAEIELRRNRSVVETRNRLYDYIAAELSDDVDDIGRILTGKFPGEDSFRTALFEAVLIGTFIKRCSNLIVLSQSGEYIDSSEISYALREMTEDIRAFGVPCHTDFSIEGNCEVSLAISILDYITRALRSGVKNMKSVNFRLLASQGMLTIRLMIEGVSELSSDHADIEGIDMSIFVKSENNSVTADILCWEAK